MMTVAIEHPLAQLLSRAAAGLALRDVAAGLQVDKSTARRTLDRARALGLVSTEGDRRTARWKLVAERAGDERWANVPGAGDVGRAVQRSAGAAELTASSARSPATSGKPVVIKLPWRLSEEYAHQQILQTGHRPEAMDGVTSVSLPDLSGADRKVALAADKWHRLIPVLADYVKPDSGVRLGTLPVSDDPLDQRRRTVKIPANQVPELDGPPSSAAELVGIWEQFAAEWAQVYAAIHLDLFGSVISYRVGRGGAVHQAHLQMDHPLRARVDEALTVLRDHAPLASDAKVVALPRPPSTVLELVEAVEIVASRLRHAYDLTALQLTEHAGL